MMNLVGILTEIKQQQPQLLELRKRFLTDYPKTLRALVIIDNERRAIKQRKGYSLMKRENKKMGFVYYVRYFHNGVLIPSKWNTHTNIFYEAEKFAVTQKDKIVNEYLSRKKINIYNFLSTFYDKDSQFFKCEDKRGKGMNEKGRISSKKILENKFIPFLKEKGITTFERVNSTVLTDFQDYLVVRGGLKSKTVNENLYVVKKVFKYLLRKGLIKDNPFSTTDSLTIKPDEVEERGCYEVNRIKGVFNYPWGDDLSYLLCLIIYTTGMRNSEIERLKLSDIESLGNYRFIDIKKGKTVNSVRKIPLHDFVYTKVLEYAKGKEADKHIFGFIRPAFHKANLDLGRLLGMTEERLKDENITFYSGRHFWKTLMNAQGLGEDVEELFMAHKVSSDVKKRYNHRDKQGLENILKKAKTEFAILDKWVL